MKTKMMIIFLCLTACGLLMAQTVHDDAAREFFRLNTPETEISDMLSENFDSILSIFIDGMSVETGLNIDTGDRETMRDLLTFILDLGLDYDKIEEISLPLIKSQFSLDELNNLNEFFQTKAGTKYLDLYVLNNTNYLVSALEQLFTALSETEEVLEQVMNKVFELYGLDSDELVLADTLGYAEPDDFDGYYDYDDGYDYAYPDSAVISDEYVTDIIDLEAYEAALKALGEIYRVTEETAPVGEPYNDYMVPYDEPPQVIGEISPIYPEFARRAGIQGTVILEVEVFKDGTVGEVKIKRSVQSGPGSLDSEAIAAVQRVKFKPAKAEGKPVNSTVIIPVEFKLN